jgi:hypothetical protein
MDRDHQPMRGVACSTIPGHNMNKAHPSPQSMQDSIDVFDAMGHWRSMGADDWPLTHHEGVSPLG